MTPPHGWSKILPLRKKFCLHNSFDFFGIKPAFVLLSSIMDNGSCG